MDFLTSHFDLPLWLSFVVFVLSGCGVAWGCQRVAFWLMFNPQEFVGIRIPLFRKLGLHQLGLEGLGWQGLVPHQRGVMAEIAVRLLTHKLLPLEEMIQRIPAKGLTDRLTPAMQETADDACRWVMQKHKPSLWESLPTFAQNSVIFKVRSIVPEVATQIVLDLQKKPSYFLSLKTLVVDAVNARPYLVVDLFKSAGKDPMAYLLRFALFSGVITALTVGIAEWQGLTWTWLLAIGLLSGTVLNKISIESLFFHPEHGVIKVGNFKGFFFRDQRHISHLFARTAADEILTTENIVRALCQGPNSKNLESLIEYHVQRAVDQQYGSIKPLLVSVLGAEEWQGIKKDASKLFAEKLESHLMAARVYLGDALRIEDVMFERLSALPALEFEKALRPVFSRYEWMMPLIGGFWGIVLAGLIIII